MTTEKDKDKDKKTVSITFKDGVSIDEANNLLSEFLEKTKDSESLKDSDSKED